MRFHYGFIVQESHEKNVISWAKFRITNQAKQKHKTKILKNITSNVAKAKREVQFDYTNSVISRTL